MRLYPRPASVLIACPSRCRCCRLHGRCHSPNDQGSRTFATFARPREVHVPPSPPNPWIQGDEAGRCLARTPSPGADRLSGRGGCSSLLWRGRNYLPFSPSNFTSATSRILPGFGQRARTRRSRQKTICQSRQRGGM